VGGPDAEEMRRGQGVQPAADANRLLFLLAQLRASVMPLANPNNLTAPDRGSQLMRGVTIAQQLVCRGDTAAASNIGIDGTHGHRMPRRHTELPGQTRSVDNPTLPK
jgi:hypothetical protein